MLGRGVVFRVTSPTAIRVTFLTFDYAYFFTLNPWVSC